MEEKKNLREERRTLLEKMEAIVNTAMLESRALTAEEERTYGELNEKFEEISKIIDKQNQLEERKLKLAQREEPLTISSASISATTSHRSADDFSSLGEMVQAIVKSASGASTDSRLLNYRAAAGLGEGSDSIGGYLLRPQYVDGLLTKIYDQGKILARCTRYQVGSGSNQLIINGIAETSRVDGSRWGGVRGYWLAEGSTKTDSKPTFSRIALTLKKCAVLVYTTDELLEDVPALTQMLNNILVSELIYQVENSIINGDGSTQPLGIACEGSPTVVVEPETGQSAETIVLANILKMWTALYPPSQPNAVWLVSPTAFAQLLGLYFNGQPLMHPVVQSADNSVMNTIFGRPVIVTEYQPAVGTPGDILLADLSQYVIAEKAPIQSAISVHVRFIYDETAIRFVYRVNGRPLWLSTLTLSDGTTSVSPFVGLGERS